MANQDYKSDKVVEIIREFENTGNKYEVNGIDTSKATIFWRKENEKFQIVPKGSYTYDSGNTYLVIQDEEILQNASEFQIVYIYEQSSSKYDEDFPQLEILVNKYNQVVDDLKDIYKFLGNTGVKSDTLQMTRVLPQLEEYCVWFLENGEIKSLPISELYAKFDSLVEALYEAIKKLLDIYLGDVKKELQEELKKAIESLNTKLEELKLELDEYTQEKIQEIQLACDRLLLIAEHKVWKANTIEGLKQMQFLKSGDVVEVLGYYQAGDGANHKRVIADSDDGSGVQLENELWANIVPNKNVRMAHFGIEGKGYGIKDETVSVQKYIDFCYRNNIVCVFDIKEVFITDTIWLKGSIERKNGGAFILSTEVNKPAFYADNLVNYIKGLRCDFWGNGGEVDNRYLILFGGFDRKSVTGLEQWRGYGVIKTATNNDKELVKNPEVVAQMESGTYTGYFFSNTVEILYGCGLCGTAIHLQPQSGGNTANYFPNVYLAREKDKVNEQKDVPYIKLISSSAVFGELNLEWATFSTQPVVYLSDGSIVAQHFYTEGLDLLSNCFFKLDYKSRVVIDEMQLGKFKLGKTNQSLFGVNHKSYVDVREVNIDDYAPLIDYQNFQFNKFEFKNEGNVYGRIVEGKCKVSFVRKEKNLLNANNILFDSITGADFNNLYYLSADINGFNNPLVDKTCFLGKIIEEVEFDTVTSTTCEAQYDPQKMLNETGLIAPKTGWYKITYKVNCDWGVELKADNRQYFVSQGGEDIEKKDHTGFVYAYAGNTIYIKNIGSPKITPQYFYGYVLVEKVGE